MGEKIAYLHRSSGGFVGGRLRFKHPKQDVGLKYYNLIYVLEFRITNRPRSGTMLMVNFETFL